MCTNVQHSAFTTTRHFLFQLLALLGEAADASFAECPWLVDKAGAGSEIWYFC